MTNHIHLVLEDRAGAMDRFMARFLGPLAKALNALDATAGEVWQTRYRASEIVDEEALLDRVVYTALNPVSAGLVAHPQDWPGLILWPGGRSRQTFTRFHARAYEQALNKARGDRSKVDRESFMERVVVEIEPPECPSYVPRVSMALAAALRRCRRQRNGRRPLGVRAILRQSPFTGSPQPKKGPLPLCHASTRAARRAYQDGWRCWVARYREASAALRAGALDVLFPEHAFRPSVPILQQRATGAVGQKE